MLEKPDIDDEKIITCVRVAYGLPISELTFLPLGADQNTAVYRAVTEDDTPYFLKLRWNFDDISVKVPRFLYEQGITEIIVPLATQTGQLSAPLDDFNLILYLFVEGRNGYEVAMTDQQWVKLGAAFRKLHDAVLPSTLKGSLQRETYSPQWREAVKSYLARVQTDVFDDPISAKTADLLREQRDVLLDLVARTERIVAYLQDAADEFVLCHADIHAGNVLITADDFYIVDWDTAILAPQERDLMYVGAGLFGNWRTPEQEVELFYAGYGEMVDVNPVALAYYRYERIIQDIAAYCDEILQSDQGDEDREQGLQYLSYNFVPNGMLEMAYRSEKALPPELKSPSA
jgi:spectinomycin phosphotransferase